MKTWKRVFSFVAVFFLILLVLFLFNQLMGLYRNLLPINAALALVVTLAFALLLLGVLLVPTLLVLRLPVVEPLPEEKEGPQYEAFLKRRLEKLRANRYLRSQQFNYEGEIERVLDAADSSLKERSLEIIKKDASAIFLTTAISQNGVLDALSILYTLMKTIYAITTLYENRPTVRRLLHLYGEVAAVVLIARSIEDMDLIEEQIEPLLATLLGGSLFSLIPGAKNITQLITSSVVEGSVNALLALRVGTITQRCLTARASYDRKSLRRGASLEAAGYLGAIIRDNAVLVVKSFSEAAVKATTRGFRKA